MRLAAISCLTLAIAACGETSSRDENRVSLPLEAPVAAHKLVTDFTEVCSLYLVDRTAGVELAKVRGWSDGMMSADAIARLSGMFVFDHEESGASLQFIPAAFPHLDVKTCMLIVRHQNDDDSPELDLSVMHQIDGLEGGFLPIPGGKSQGVGRWSFIGPNGQPVTIAATRPNAGFTQMHMTTHKRLYPK